MANKIIDELIEERIDIFRSAFAQRAKILFHDAEKHNKLMHPGEFGTYREGITRDFLQSFLPQRLTIDTGFVVNALGETSGQIDLVIYDPSLTPALESKNRQKFFPIETVIAAGEVKSNVKRDEFEKALIRLAKIKQMRSNLPKEASSVVRWHGLEKTEYNPDKIPVDQVFTFLICNKIDFPLCNDPNFPATLNSMYESVAYKHRHSSVLSLEDGLLLYTAEFPKGELIDCWFPIFPAVNRTTINTRNKLIRCENDNYIHFKYFCTGLFFHAAHCTVGYVNLMDYVNTGKVHYWIEKPKPKE